MFQELKSLLKSEAEIKEEEFGLENATTIYELGYSFKDAMKKLKEAGIPIVLTKSEKEETFKEMSIAIEAENLSMMELIEKGLPWGYKGRINRNSIESIEDIVAIHKTNYPPKGNKIDSRYSGNVLHDCSITLGGEKYSFTCKSGRDSVHLSANHEVSPNNGGDWDEMKYAVIISFKDLRDNSIIKSAQSVDIYTKGPVALTENCYILCPKGESKEIQANNPNVTVIEYEGEYVQDYANMFISEMGYKLEPGSDYGFRDTEQDNKYSKMMEKEGIPIKRHFWSEDKKREEQLGDVYKLVGILKLIKGENLVEKIGKEKLIDGLLKDNGLGYYIDIALNTVPEYEDIFIKELNEIGIAIDVNEIKKTIKQHINEDGIIDNDPRLIITHYLMDAIESKSIDKQKDNRFEVNSTAIARVSKDIGITISEMDKAKGVTEPEKQPKRR